MTKTEFIKSSSRTETERWFVSEMKTTVKALREALTKPSVWADDNLASAALRSLRAGWLLTRNWDS